MASHEYMGRVGVSPLSAIADKCAFRIRHAKTALAVAVDPAGYVTVEPFEHAVPDEVVGVYDKQLGLLDLYRQVRDDLAYEIGTRRAVGRRAA